jgi:uncharacterized phage-associated protein
MTDTKAIIETIHYVLHKLGRVDKLKILKLIFFSDKYHLLRYGRTITGDDYYAMYCGPVASTVKDVLEFSNFLSEEDKKMVKGFFNKVGDNDLELKKMDMVMEYDMLSESDMKAIDATIEKFGAMTSIDLSNYTHKYPEWYQYDDMFRNNKTKRQRIKNEELLSVIKEDRDFFAVDEADIEESRKILTGLIASERTGTCIRAS